jgi:integrase
MKIINKLSALAIGRLATPGYYSDGGNLFLQVTAAGSKSWIFRYSVGANKKREMGLGPLHAVSLASAREKSARYRAQLLEGIDPHATRKTALAERRAASVRAMTFKECASKCIEDRRAGWKNAKHAQQWENTLETYVYPFMGAVDVAQIDTATVRRCLDPIWNTKTETAMRVRGRVETVLDWAKTHGHRAGDNPAAWKGHLQAVLAPPRKVTAVEHHPALSIAQMPAFQAALRLKAGMASKALTFLILTAARTNEITGAQWAEIDLKDKVWTVPPERMKAGMEHKVPLSDAAVSLLEGLGANTERDAFIFPGQKKGKPLSNMAMLELLKGMAFKSDEGAPITVHGFRSTFRQWAAEMSAHSREVAEHALAHKLPDKVEAAYQRGTLLAKRRALMADWAKFCEIVPH